MAETVARSLNDKLLPLLQKERFVLLTTIDKDTGGPSASAISWVYAPNGSMVYLAVDNRSKIVENVKHNKLVSISLIGAGSVYSIFGDAAITVEKMEGVPLKLAKISVSVTEVRDVMFYGSRISTEPAYEKTYDKQAAEKLDQQVMAALQK